MSVESRPGPLQQPQARAELKQPQEAVLTLRRYESLEGCVDAVRAERNKAARSARSLGVTVQEMASDNSRSTSTVYSWLRS